jgi:hypothetical protein
VKEKATCFSFNTAVSFSVPPGWPSALPVAAEVPPAACVSVPALLVSPPCASVGHGPVWVGCPQSEQFSGCGLARRSPALVRLTCQPVCLLAAGSGGVGAVLLPRLRGASPLPHRKRPGTSPGDSRTDLTGLFRELVLTGRAERRGAVDHPLPGRCRRPTAGPARRPARARRPGRGRCSPLPAQARQPQRARPIQLPRLHPVGGGLRPLRDPAAGDDEESED